MVEIYTAIFVYMILLGTNRPTASLCFQNKQFVIMRFAQPLSILTAILSTALAHDAPKPPTLTLLYSMACDLAPEMSMGAVPTGQERIIIPIIGGTFNGSRISGRKHLSHYPGPL